MSFFNPVHFSSLNFTISDFEHPNLQLIERYFVPVEFFLTTVVFVAFLYVAIFHSPKSMKSYSVLLIYQVCTTYVFDLLTITIQPVLLLPYAGAYVNGFWQFGEQGNSIIFLLFMLNIIVIMHAFTLQFIFRLAALYKPKNWFHKFSQLKFIWLFMLPFLIFLLAVITFGFAMDQPEGEKFRQTLASEYSFFIELFQRHEFAMGYHPSFSNGIKIMFGAIVLMSYIYPLLIVLVYFFYFRQLNFVKNNLNEKNKSLHVMLLRALIAQSIILFIFILFPFEIVGSALVFPHRHASFAASCAPLFVMVHTIIDILCLFYFIKPYKNWVIKSFRILHGRQITPATTIELTNAFTPIPKIKITMQK